MPNVEKQLSFFVSAKLDVLAGDDLMIGIITACQLRMRPDA